MAEYYMAEGSAQRGPFKLEDLARQGVRADTLVWAEGMATWLRADQVPEVKAALGSSSGAGATTGGAAAYDAPAPYPTAEAPTAAYPQQPQYAQPAQYAQPQQYGQPYGQYPAGQYPGYPQTGYPQPYQPGGVPPGAANSKVAAGLCGILIGSLGIHKFVLGMNGAGVIMLLVTVLTCGWGGLIMGTIGLIEGIIYLTKSDEEFYQTYVVQKKQWF